MTKRLLGAALVATMWLGSACNSVSPQGGSSAQGSLALTQDDSTLLAVDADRDSMFVIDAASNKVLREVKVGKQPEKIIVGLDDTAYITNRLSRSVSIVRAGDSAETARLEVGVEPVGLALSTDGKTLFVVNAASRTNPEVGTLMAFDTSTRAMKWEATIGHEPRGIALLPGDRAAVTLYKDGEVVMVSTKSGLVQQSETKLYENLNKSALGLNTGNTGRGLDVDAAPPPFKGLDPFQNGLPKAHPRGLEAIAASPDGTQLYVGSLLSTDETLNVRRTTTGSMSDVPFDQSSSGGSGYGSVASCGASSAAAPAVFTLTAGATIEPKVEDLGSCGSFDTDRPSMILRSNQLGVPVQGPTAMALDQGGRFLFIANRESNNVSIIATRQDQTNSINTGFGGAELTKRGAFPESFGGGTIGDSTQHVVSVGKGPTGVALTHDSTKAYVLNAFDHSISRLEVDQKTGQVINAETKQFAEDVLPVDVVAGRKLFFDASNGQMNNAATTGISCASCHLEGREDGHVWHFQDGPRQTPSLSGRNTLATAPLHWNGEFENLLTFMSHTVKDRMGGTGVTPAMEQQMAAFINSMPAADNAARETIGADALARGLAVYNKAGCGSCHSGQNLTDNAFYDVGTYVKKTATNSRPDDMAFLPKGLNTPSLLGLGRTAPYLHDGSAMTLKARIVQGKADSRHGATAQLSDAEVDDLVLYLKTL